MSESTEQRKPQKKDLESVEHLARLLDESLKIPGTNYRIGLDGLIGLIPGIGDVSTALISGYIIYQGHRMNMSRFGLLRMYGNVLLDLLIGAIPFLGDLFDFVWKSNSKNVRILKKHVQSRVHKNQE